MVQRGGKSEAAQTVLVMRGRTELAHVISDKKLGRRIAGRGDTATVAVYERATGITNERHMNQLGR